MKPVLVYQVGSETIRQMPQNYLIAHFDGHKWLCEPDLAADKKLAMRVFQALFDHKTKYNKDGLFLLSKVTPNKECYKINDVDLDTIDQWAKANKLKRKDKRLLIEAYRRYHSFKHGEDIKTAIVGLGNSKEYKSIYFLKKFPVNRETYDTWWTLTDKGAKLVEELSIRLPWNKDYTINLF